MQNISVLNAVRDKIIEILNKGVETAYDYCDLKRCVNDYLYLASKSIASFSIRPSVLTYQNCICHYVNDVLKENCEYKSCANCWNEYLLKEVNKNE